MSNTISSSEQAKNPLAQELYDIICCPMDKSDLKYTPDKKGLKCVKCKYVYPIKDGIPILLPPELQEKDKQETKE